VLFNVVIAKTNLLNCSVVVIANLGNGTKVPQAVLVDLSLVVISLLSYACCVARTSLRDLRIIAAAKLPYACHITAAVLSYFSVIVLSMQLCNACQITRIPLVNRSITILYVVLENNRSIGLS